MSAAKKCDRCGNFYEKNERVKGKCWYRNNRLAGVNLMTTNSKCDREYELCDECLEKLVRFLDGEDITCEICNNGDCMSASC